MPLRRYQEVPGVFIGRKRRLRRGARQRREIGQLKIQIALVEQGLRLDVDLLGAGFFKGVIGELDAI